VSRVEECNRRMLRARDAMDRAFGQPLDVPHLARIAEVSEAHFSRTDGTDVGLRDPFGNTFESCS
jgi:transcriptional regulator GlxA family with amidase domain